MVRTVWSRKAGGLSTPIVFTQARRRPIGLEVHRTPAQEKLEIIEKLLDPWLSKLVHIFITKVNTCLPILEETEFRKQFENDRQNVSPALLACLYAHTLAFWTSDPVLVGLSRPDTRFIWNLASEALYSELRLSPGISTIAAIILNMGGRPSTLVFNNVGQLGFAISIAFTLGLNHDPSTWDIPDHEKRLRMNLWWALVIHDRWSSLAFGVPLRIRHVHTDVPTPPTHSSNQSGVPPATAVFSALVSLTEVLAEYLEIIYQTQKENPQRGLANRLREFTGTTTGHIRRILLRGSDLSSPGAANLRLAFLSIQYLHSRIELEGIRSTSVNYAVNGEIKEQYLQTRWAAEEIVVFVQELESAQLQDVWLPEMAFSLTSVMSFLIRSAVEHEDTKLGLASNGTLGLAHDMMEALSSHRGLQGWDIGELCLTQYSAILEKIQDRESDVDLTGIDSDILESLAYGVLFQDSLLFPKA